MALPRTLVPAPSRLPARLSSPMALLPARALPLATRVATVALAGLAAEHLLRLAANRAIDSFGRGAADRTVKAIVTEITVVERFRRD